MGVNATIWADPSRCPSAAFPITFQSPISFSFDCCGVQGTGRIPKTDSPFIDGMLKEKALQLQVSCSAVNRQGNRGKLLNAERLAEVPCSVSIILYGPRNLAEDVGCYCTEAEEFLQDPIGCERNVKYWNPHRLSICDQEDCQMTFDLNFMSDPTALEDFPNVNDILESFHSDENLDETSQPNALRTALRRYQSEALLVAIESLLIWIQPPKTSAHLHAFSRKGLVFA